MKLLDLTLPTPAENLALDEALLECAEANTDQTDVLRLWESPQYAVVVGRGSRISEEVDRAYCARHRIPILRRCSGGAAVVIGPGCLMYSVVLMVADRPHLRVVEQAHRFVLERIAQALRSLNLSVQLAGTSDLTLADRKFSGNSLRCKRNALLYHGTLLYDLPLELISACLKTPPRRPAYRGDRLHGDFLQQLPDSADRLRQALVQAWACTGPRPHWPIRETEQLVRQRYAQDAWNLQR